jgi:hypothetical protein
MFSLVMRSKQSLVWFAAGVLVAGAVADVHADASANPYDLIVERNPFGLKPPPPPPDPTEISKPPSAPPATVELTGITSILSSKRALFEIIPGPGKPMIKPVLAEGDRLESIEVVSINVDKNEVTVKNGGILTNLTFKVARSAPAQAVPPVPGSIPPPIVPGVVPGTPKQSAYNNNQTSSSSGRYNVMVSGGNGSVNPAPTPNYGAVNPALSGGVTPAVNPGVSVNDGGLRSIPSRNLRTAPQAQEPVLSRDEQYQIMEENRLKNEALRVIGAQQGRNIAIPPLPPTPYTPPDAPGYIPPPLPPGFQQTR